MFGTVRNVFRQELKALDVTSMRSLVTWLLLNGMEFSSQSAFRIGSIVYYEMSYPIHLGSDQTQIEAGWTGPKRNIMGEGFEIFLILSEPP
jgi:hypothetical protein